MPSQTKTLRSVVYFTHEDAKLDPAARTAIREVAQAIPAGNKVVSVKGVGYLQSSGVVQSGQGIAVRRAAAVDAFFTRLRSGGEHTVSSGGSGGPGPRARRATLTVRYSPPPPCPALTLQIEYTFINNTGTQTFLVTPTGAPATVSYSELPDYISAASTGLSVDTDGPYRPNVPVTVTVTPRNDDCATVTVDTSVTVNIITCPGGNPDLSLLTTFWQFDVGTGTQSIPVTNVGGAATISYSALPSWITATPDGLDVNTDSLRAFRDVTVTATPEDNACEIVDVELTVTVVAASRGLPGAGHDGHRLPL